MVLGGGSIPKLNARNWQNELQELISPLTDAYASGHVVVWDDPDVYSSYHKMKSNVNNHGSQFHHTNTNSTSNNNHNSTTNSYITSHHRHSNRHSRAKTIREFDNRCASAATFLDERHIIAVVGDPTAPPSVGNSLRIFDTREANSSFHASWSAAVNHQFVLCK